MTVAPSHQTFRSVQVPSDTTEPKTKGRAVSLLKCIPDTEHRRKWFADLMWRTFPGASVREKALRAAPVLELSPRQCENLMNKVHDPKLPQILAVLAISGAENIFEIVGQK